jgi:hypothetical protein
LALTLTIHGGAQPRNLLLALRKYERGGLMGLEGSKVLASGSSAKFGRPRVC